VHSGDSSCALPPITLGASDIENVRRSTEAIARGIGVRGLLNVQYALKDDVLYVLEANPRASRTVPFVSKATAVSMAKAASRVMLGATIAELREEGLLPRDPKVPGRTAVKESVFPFRRFHGIDPVLGPEMKSTGEVMGIDSSFGKAFAKSQTAVTGHLPAAGKVLVAADRDERELVGPVGELAELGFDVLAEQEIADLLDRNGIPCAPVTPDDAVGEIDAEKIALVVSLHGRRRGGRELRTRAVARNIPCVTTARGLRATVEGLREQSEMDVCPLQENDETEQE
jgi:carbamoyl-phosphate synthase large subunit